MREPRLASIVITNYNYAHYLGECVESALNQAYPNIEVIVVDDGSTDDSRDIIASYGRRVVPVFKPNGGIGSAFNVGFAVSRGDIVCFVDADDILLPAAVETAIPLFGPGVAKVQWPLWLIDARGRRTGGRQPPQPLEEGDLREHVIRGGVFGYSWPVTTGNAWCREFLERVLPMPEHEYRGAAESYLAALAPLWGLVRTVPEPMATYRMHEHSLSRARGLAEYIALTERRHSALQTGFRKLGVNVDPDLWEPTAKTRQRIILSCQELAALFPAGSSFVFVEWDQWGPGQIVPGCHAIPFLERDGEYWGRPLDDATAISELQRLRRSGASFIAFGSPALWWLDYYTSLRDHLHSNFTCVLANDRLVVFDLRSRLEASRELRAAESR